MQTKKVLARGMLDVGKEKVFLTLKIGYRKFYLSSWLFYYVAIYIFPLCLCFRLIFEKFSSTDPNSKDNSVGIQLLGIVMANNLPPYDPKCGIESIK